MLIKIILILYLNISWSHENHGFKNIFSIIFFHNDYQMKDGQQNNLNNLRMKRHIGIK